MMLKLLRRKTNQSGLCCFAVIAVAFIASACATNLNMEDPAGTEWTNVEDCFARDLVILPSNAREIANVCSGGLAAENANRTGMQRSTATYHAANALYQLSEQAILDLNVARGAELLSDAAKQIDDSYFHEARRAADEPTSRFMLNRDWLAARIAFSASGISGDASVYCGLQEQCVDLAANGFEALDLTHSFLKFVNQQTGKEQGDPLLCRVLDSRSEAYQAIGNRYIYLAQEDLNRVVNLCPGQTALATDRLAEIAFLRGEQVRQGLFALTDIKLDRERVRRDSQTAIADFEKAKTVSRFAFSAQRRIGEILLWRSGWDDQRVAQTLQLAADAFDLAAQFAAAEQDFVAEAEMLSLKGDSYFRLAQSVPTQSADIASFYQESLDAYGSAVSIDATPDRRLALGRVEVAIGELDRAKTNYRIGISGLSGEPKAIAQLELASIHERLGETSEAQDLINQVFANSSQWPDIQFELGKRLFRLGDIQSARRALVRSVEKLSSNDLAEATYLLSVTDTILRPADWKTKSVERSERAVQLGDGDPRYARQACLAHIVRSGETLRRGSDAPWCERRGSPTEYLLSGMYLLKRAQVMEVSAYNPASQSRWRSVLRDAETAFRNGLNAIADEADEHSKVRFDDLQREVNIAVELSNGLVVIDRCRRDTIVEPGDAKWSALDAFYGHYGVLRCS